MSGLVPRLPSFFGSLGTSLGSEVVSLHVASESPGPEVVDLAMIWYLPCMSAALSGVDWSVSLLKVLPSR